MYKMNTLNVVGIKYMFRKSVLKIDNNFLNLNVKIELQIVCYSE